MLLVCFRMSNFLTPANPLKWRAYRNRLWESCLQHEFISYTSSKGCMKNGSRFSAFLDTHVKTQLKFLKGRNNNVAFVAWFIVFEYLISGKQFLFTDGSSVHIHCSTLEAQSPLCVCVCVCVCVLCGGAQWYSAGLRAGWSGVRVSVGAGNFSLHHRLQMGSGAHPATYPMCTRTRDSFPGANAEGAWNWPLTFI
jgi:hypothetical protein